MCKCVYKCIKLIYIYVLCIQKKKKITKDITASYTIFSTYTILSFLQEIIKYFSFIIQLFHIMV